MKIFAGIPRRPVFPRDPVSHPRALHPRVDDAIAMNNKNFAEIATDCTDFAHSFWVCRINVSTTPIVNSLGF